MPMNPESKDKVQLLNDALIDWMADIYGRWLDEKEYEEWKDYVAILRKSFEKEYRKLSLDGAYFLKASKKPFGFIFVYDNWQVMFYVNSKERGWKAKPIPKRY